MQLEFNLHPAQMQVFEHPARHKVVVAGRRFGKSYLARVMCLIHALEDKNKYGYDLKSVPVYYIAPTFDQAKRSSWNRLKELAQPVIKSVNENAGVIKLVNDREIHFKGSDRPDTIRGDGLGFVVLDEYATMKPEVWEYVVSPMLTDVMGSSLFIGSPDGKNHFFELHRDAGLTQKKAEEVGEIPSWSAFTFTSMDNPTIPIKQQMEDEMKMGKPAEVIRQEYMASFHASGGKVFKEDDLVICPEPDGGQYYIAVDPAGYEDVGTKSGAREDRLDETAIAIVKVGPYGWFVKEIRTGRWGVREASIQILKAAKDYQALTVGIEKGSLKNAVMPYLSDQMRRLGVFPHIVDVSHGGKKKTERIIWALQGRMQHGRLMFPDDTSDADNPRWKTKFINQMLDFPNPLSHDDMLDALAYIDQVAVANYMDEDDYQEDWTPLDSLAGY